MVLGNAEVTDHLITVSLALATMAASSSSVMSMARLNWVGVPFCGAVLPVISIWLSVAGNELCRFN